MKIGTKVKVDVEHAFTGVISRPTRENLPLPSPDWVIIKCDDGRGKLCVHRDMLIVLP